MLVVVWLSVGCKRVQACVDASKAGVSRVQHNVYRRHVPEYSGYVASVCVVGERYHDAYSRSPVSQ
eukprot:9674234-Prorocentrum_lima.AAC.1